LRAVRVNGSSGSHLELVVVDGFHHIIQRSRADHGPRRALEGGGARARGGGSERRSAGKPATAARHARGLDGGWEETEREDAAGGVENERLSEREVEGEGSGGVLFFSLIRPPIGDHWIQGTGGHTQLRSHAGICAVTYPRVWRADSAVGRTADVEADMVANMASGKCARDVESSSPKQKKKGTWRFTFCQNCSPREA